MTFRRSAWKWTTAVGLVLSAQAVAMGCADAADAAMMSLSQSVYVPPPPAQGRHYVRPGQTRSVYAQPQVLMPAPLAAPPAYAPEGAKDSPVLVPQATTTQPPYTPVLAPLSIEPARPVGGPYRRPVARAAAALPAGTSTTYIPPQPPVAAPESTPVYYTPPNTAAVEPEHVNAATVPAVQVPIFTPAPESLPPAAPSLPDTSGKPPFIPPAYETVPPSMPMSEDTTPPATPDSTKEAHPIPPGFHAEVIDATDANAPPPIDPPHPTDILEPAKKVQLSDETRRILDALPSKMDAQPQTAPKQFSIKRYDPEIEGILNAPVEAATDNVEKAEASGVKIEVRRPQINADYELEKAYNALLSGQSDIAIEIYKNILKADASNQAALFGLATTYHRIGDVDLARPFYGKLLGINPDHRDALNNFLVLVSEESPEDAIKQMEALEDKNPDFSPLPAQMAMLYQKLGNPETARQKMARAVALAPDNLAYKYNFAVLLDQQGHAEEALTIYREIIAAALRGEVIPANMASIQERANYLSTLPYANAQNSVSGIQ